jgi:hypothetical protein
LHLQPPTAPNEYIHDKSRSKPFSWKRRFFLDTKPRMTLAIATTQACVTHPSNVTIRQRVDKASDAGVGAEQAPERASECGVEEEGGRRRLMKRDPK